MSKTIILENGENKMEDIKKFTTKYANKH